MFVLRFPVVDQEFLREFVGGLEEGPPRWLLTARLGDQRLPEDGGWRSGTRCGDGGVPGSGGAAVGRTCRPSPWLHEVQASTRFQTPSASCPKPWGFRTCGKK